jgi:UDP-glucose 4-epimerase
VNVLDRRTLITGASGFIGSYLRRRLLNDGAEIFAISRFSRPSVERQLHWYQGDLSDYSVTRNLLKEIKPDLVFHLAGYPVGARTLENVLPTFRSNLAATVNVLSALAEMGCARILLAGSLEEPDKRDETIIGSSPYAVSKWAASEYGRMFHLLFQLPVVVLRKFMVYGPEQRDTTKLVPYTIQSLLLGESPRITSGRRMVDWIYVEDAVEGMIAAVRADNIEGLTIDIGSGILVSIRDVVERLVCIINPKIAPAFGAVEERPFEQERVADVTRTLALTGWQGPTVSLEEGLSRTVEWYAAHSRAISKESAFSTDLHAV